MGGVGGGSSNGYLPSLRTAVRLGKRTEAAAEPGATERRGRGRALGVQRALGRAGRKGACGDDRAVEWRDLRRQGFHDGPPGAAAATWSARSFAAARCRLPRLNCPAVVWPIGMEPMGHHSALFTGAGKKVPDDAVGAMSVQSTKTGRVEHVWNTCTREHVYAGRWQPSHRNHLQKAAAHYYSIAGPALTVVQRMLGGRREGPTSGVGDPNAREIGNTAGREGGAAFSSARCMGQSIAALLRRSHPDAAATWPIAAAAAQARLAQLARRGAALSALCAAWHQAGQAGAGAVALVAAGTRLANPGLPGSTHCAIVDVARLAGAVQAAGSVALSAWHTAGDGWARQRL